MPEQTRGGHKENCHDNDGHKAIYRRSHRSAARASSANFRHARRTAADHDPRPLHYQLETNFPGQFGWDYLEEGPEIWRVEIARLEEGAGCECCCGSDH